VLKMEHFEYIDNEMAKNDELCAVGKLSAWFILSKCLGTLARDYHLIIMIVPVPPEQCDPQKNFCKRSSVRHLYARFC
jgi:hypothetical protein